MNPLTSLDRLPQHFRTVCERLIAAAVAGRPLAPAAVWLVDNHDFLQTQAREVREALPRANRRRLPAANGVPRIHALAVDLAAQAGVDFTAARLQELLTADERIPRLTLAELWALGPMLKLVLLAEIAAVSDFESAHSESVLRRALTALRAFDSTPWRDLVEAASPVEQILRRDPIHPRMTFRTRDDCRRVVEGLARHTGIDEPAVATRAVALARAYQRPVAWFLLGPGRSQVYSHTSVRDILRRFPNLYYLGGIAALTAAAILLAQRLAGPLPFWYLALLLLPAMQAAVTIMNRVVNLTIPPRTLPRMDFSEGIPGEFRTFVVVPTLLLSRAEVEKLLERLEIHYLANRDPNLLFALLTDFPDAAANPDLNDAPRDLLDAAVEGIRALNRRYRNGHSPFYLFHRAPEWNKRESVWMGRERKRGKLNDFNTLLLGGRNAFDVIEGDLTALPTIRYVITLDSDTQLPRDAARELIATLAHPLNSPVIDPETGTVREGYAILQPRVSISMDSACRSRMARIYIGQTGFDPYTTAVSDVYQDLHGCATFTGKGIYDVRAFHAAAGERFPDNALLSHDLIEGEHARVGLVSDLEVIDDYPSSYQTYCKRKHRWVRGDWQIAPWIFGHRNPLGLLSRWKIFDNLRRSLLEISLLALLLTGGTAGLWIALAVLALPAYTDLIFSLLRLPHPRFWGAYLREQLFQFGRAHLDVLLNLVFLPEQAFLMADAVIRTLVRRTITHRRLLEWQTMAQAEAQSGRRFNLFTLYLYLCPALAVPVTMILNVHLILVELWVAAPLVALWLNGRPSTRRRSRAVDPDFLRSIALRTWRYFADYSVPDGHWLAPDNVQEDPPAVATRTSPTNLGLQLAANLAAHDFGYVTHQELAMRLDRILDSMSHLERSHGHFYNWYDTRSLRPLAPCYVSTVDSGNLLASLVALKQGCLALADRPLIDRATLDSIRDHCLAFRDSLPPSARSSAVMQLCGSLLKQCEAEPTGLLFWESVLTDMGAIIGRLREPVERMCPRFPDACYWFEALAARLEIALNDLSALAPWLAPPFETELRMCSPSLPDLVEELCRVPRLGQLPAHYQSIARAVRRRLEDPGRLPEITRYVLLRLLEELRAAEMNAGRLLGDFRRLAGLAESWIAEMDFAFLFDKRSKLLHIGYDAGAQSIDPAGYDLLASEARTAVFLAIAKGDIPRDAWFRLGRRLTSCRGERSLISWSGTMFEYLMPALFMRTYSQTLLGQSLQAALRIQRQYARERRVPWGISEAAFGQRDHALHYQYRAFGIPALAADPKLSQRIVVAPYAGMLGALIDPAAATENLRQMASAGWLARHGFYESVDYAGGQQEPEIVRSHMVHHQAMGLIALGNALLDGAMQQRFHADPMVAATDFLLQERVPALLEVTPVLPPDRTLRPGSFPGSTALHSRASAAQ